MRLALRLIHSLRMQVQRGFIALNGKRHGVSVWRLPAINDKLMRCGN
jgi:hypothetical protein